MQRVSEHFLNCAISTHCINVNLLQVSGGADPTGADPNLQSVHPQVMTVHFS